MTFNSEKRQGVTHKRCTTRCTSPRVSGICPNCSDRVLFGLQTTEPLPEDYTSRSTSISPSALDQLQSKYLSAKSHDRPSDCRHTGVRMTLAAQERLIRQAQDQFLLPRVQFPLIARMQERLHEPSVSSNDTQGLCYRLWYKLQATVVTTLVRYNAYNLLTRILSSLLP